MREQNKNMRTLITTCAIGVLFLACSHPSDIRQALDSQLAMYPESTLQDIYKTFYQDRFGSGHMIADTASAWDYLTWETAETALDTILNPYYEPTGAQGRYVRVHLRCVNEQLISEEQLFDAFLRSAKPTESTTNSWEQEWNSLLETLGPKMVASLDRDSVLEELNLAAATDHAVRHSYAYRNAYHPHYRIVERDIFEKELKPLLPKND